MVNVTNGEIARILSEISQYLEMQAVPFKPRAYAKASENIVSLDRELNEIYRAGGLKGLQELPGVGMAISEKIEELLTTGRLKYYEDLKKKTPVDLAGLSGVEGLGPKSIRSLYQKLGVKNLRDLKAAATKGKIRNLVGFGLIVISLRLSHEPTIAGPLPEMSSDLERIHGAIDRVPPVGFVARTMQLSMMGPA